MDYTTEVADGGKTFYLRLPDAGGRNHDTAVFIPDRFHTSPNVDLILFLHGYTDAGKYPDVRAYMHNPKIQPLRKAVADDGRFALAMPYLGDRSNAQFVTGSDAALAAYLNWVVGFVADNGPGQNVCLIQFALNKLVLAGHSGGGTGLLEAAQRNGTFASRLQAVWALDCMYGGEGGTWAGWARTHPDVKLHVLWHHYHPEIPNPAKDEPTKKQADRISAAGLSNVTVEEAAVEHGMIPAHHFPALLRTLTAP